MNIVRESRLIEALAAWGEHEANGMLQGAPKLTKGDALGAANFALVHRAPLISKILDLWPHAVYLVDLVPEDAKDLSLYNGLSFDQWISSADKKARKHFDALRDAPEAPAGPLLICAHRQNLSQGFVFDGCHRGAAWFDRCRAGRPSGISAYLIACNPPAAAAP